MIDQFINFLSEGRLSLLQRNKSSTKQSELEKLKASGATIIECGLSAEVFDIKDRDPYEYKKKKASEDHG